MKEVNEIRSETNVNSLCVRVISESVICCKRTTLTFL